jgi:hypothetical protein
MPNRNPLTDPRPGDVVAGRRVEERIPGGGLTYRWVTPKGYGELRYIPLSTWAAWSKHKEVEHVAQE